MRGLRGGLTGTDRVTGSDSYARLPGRFIMNGEWVNDEGRDFVGKCDKYSWFS